MREGQSGCCHQDHERERERGKIYNVGRRHWRLERKVTVKDPSYHSVVTNPICEFGKNLGDEIITLYRWKAYVHELHHGLGHNPLTKHVAY